MSRSTKPYQVKDPYASTVRNRGCRTEEYNEAMKRRFARLALKSCQNSQSVEFEVEEILHYQLGFLNESGTPPENYRVWIHLSFTALPKNADRNVVTPLHFFAELSYRVGGFPYEVKTCSTFEPRNDIGFKHGCLICPDSTRFHPGNDVYVVGYPHYYVMPE